MQLNVSYNFKRLALKNDFYIRQYMIENGMNLLKENDDDGMETALEFHQIHNVIRTSNRRPLIAPPPPPQITTTTTMTTTVSDLRRNSTTSSVSGLSAMIMNGCETNQLTSNGTSSRNGNDIYSTLKPFNVRPIQIKTEPIDPDYEEAKNGKQMPTVQSSPTNSSGSLSILTVNSSRGASSVSRAKTPPMIVINERINYKNTPDKTPKKNLSVVVKESPRNIDRPPPRKASQKQDLPKSSRKNDPQLKLGSLRSIKKPPKHFETKKKLREAAMRTIDKKKKEKSKKDQKKNQQKIKLQGSYKKTDKPRGRPPLNKGKAAKAKTDKKN